jgi:hypothetical protein
MRKLVKDFLGFLPWAILALIAAYLVIGGGWKDIMLGRYQHKTLDFFKGVGGATEVRIYRLAGTDEQSTSETFSINAYPRPVTVYGSVALTGDDLETFLKLWRMQSTIEGPGAKCHEPPYGFRIYYGPQVLRETSICWGCSNFHLDCWPFGSRLQAFDSRSAVAKELLDFCDKRLPYARSGEKSELTR